jgi:hypothetical protein
MSEDILKICADNYKWPEDFNYSTQVEQYFEDIININDLVRIIRSYDPSKDIVVTFLSKEYLSIGKLWISYSRKVGITQYIIISADKETNEYLKTNHIPSISAKIGTTIYNYNHFKSLTNFNKKGLAITALKFPIIKFILKEGYRVILCDIDALILSYPESNNFIGSDISFQRVIYFPKKIAQKWGFTACSGFVRFLPSKKCIRLIDNAISIQKYTYSDQISLNIALYNDDVRWDSQIATLDCCDEICNRDLKHEFVDKSLKIYSGISTLNKLTIKALSPVNFYRNEIVPYDPSNIVVFHPNSPKTQSGKLEVFSRYGIT